MIEVPSISPDDDEANAEAEHRVLTSESGRRLIAEVEAEGVITPALIVRWRKGHNAKDVDGALRIVDARKRGSRKFDGADAMWLDAVGLEQATPEAVARHQARRFVEAGAPVVVDLCSGIGGDAIALAEAGLTVVAVDRSRAMARRLRWNARVRAVSDRVLATQGDAERSPTPLGGFVHVDPDRRASGGPRAKRIAGYRPGPDFLKGLAGRTDGVAIKLGPASDFADHFDRPGWEVELVSLGGECKTATARAGLLQTCRRRATTLPTGATWTDLDGPLDAIAPAAGAPLRFVHDPDPALVRSGLLDGFALAQELQRLVEGVDLLTSDGPGNSPWLADFAVRDVFPFDLKRLKAYVARRGLGPLEIKIRGLTDRPEVIRAKLRPASGSPATLILVGHRGPSLAIVAERVGSVVNPAPT